MSPEEARRAALRAFGNVTRAQERFYESGRMMWLDDLRRDLKHVFRMLVKNRGFTLVAVLTLALGIGANTAIFSVVYGVLLKPLPFHEPEGLVAVDHRAPGLNVPLIEQGAATYFTYRESNQVFDDIGLWNSEEVSITGHGEPERAQALWVTEGVLPILRVPPLVGRFFTQEDDSPGSPRRVILAHGYWQRRFGGAADVIGRSLNVNGTPARSSAFCPPRSSSCTPIRPCCCRSGSIGRRCASAISAIGVSRGSNLASP